MGCGDTWPSTLWNSPSSAPCAAHSFHISCTGLKLEFDSPSWIHDETWCCMSFPWTGKSMKTRTRVYSAQHWIGDSLRLISTTASLEVAMWHSIYPQVFDFRILIGLLRYRYCINAYETVQRSRHFLEVNDSWIWGRNISTHWTRFTVQSGSVQYCNYTCVFGGWINVAEKYESDCVDGIQQIALIDPSKYAWLAQVISPHQSYRLHFQFHFHNLNPFSFLRLFLMGNYGGVQKRIW